jgi:anti-sigma B factor antagonist
MEIQQDAVGEVAILRPAGRMEAGADRTQIVWLRTAISDLLAQDRVRVVLDLAEVTSMDAEGLGELAYAFQRLSRAGGTLVLAAPAERVRRLLSVTRLDKVFSICGSEEAAVRQLRAWSPPSEVRPSPSDSEPRLARSRASSITASGPWVNL